MKRLWVRFSLVVVGIVLLSVLALAGASYIIRNTVDKPPRPPENFEINGPPEDIEKHRDEWRNRALRALAENMLIGSVVGGVLAIGAGILLSRSLTNPLNDLTQAARAIGKGQLDYRVDERGSTEMIAVGTAFNQMAGELEQAEHLRRNLLADISHELRTPLTLLKGNLRAMLDGVYEMEAEEIARLYDQTRHLTRLIEDLHELAQAEAQKLPLRLQSVDVTDIIKQVALVFIPLADEKNVELVLDVLQNLPTVEVDSQRIEQVLHNLLSNALRHTIEGTITLKATTSSEHLSISIQDTGDGIAAEDLPHVFDRFYRSDVSRTRDTGGTGLGLAIVKALVEAHQGQVNVESAGIGQGTTITILLPLPYSQPL